MDLGDTFGREVVEKCSALMEKLISSPHNLTAIRDLERAMVIHVEDSLKPFSMVGLEGKTFLDIGSGGGVPGLVIAIAFPQTKWTLMDSILKKVREIDRFSYELGLRNVQTVVSRAEEHRGLYDGVFMRAVARSDVSLELAAPLTEKNGRVFLYKGPGWKDERERALRAAEKLGLILESLLEYNLSDNSPRVLAVFRKLFKTPQRFPRKIGIAAKFPLGESE